MVRRRKSLRQETLRQAVAVVAAVTCLSLLAACGEDEKPELKRTPASETPSASESPSASETPEPQPESAKAFIRRWQKASDEMQVTGKTKSYLQMTTRNCDSCRSVAKSIAEVYEAGGEVRFAGSTIDRLTRIGGTKQRQTFEMRLTVPESTVIERAGAQARTLTGGSGTFVIELKRRGASWKVDSSLLRAQS